jgi:NTP pyrophosphatase (non-canonical NTP hydrolase)
MTIQEIQDWEKSFSQRKGISQDYEKSLQIATLKLGEEVGEVYKAIIEKKWEEVSTEIFDVIIFACKIANLMEQFHGVKPLTEISQSKMNYCEKRTYDKTKNKMDKPEVSIGEQK